MPESMNVRQALRELNKAEQQILTIRQALEGLSPTDPLPAGEVIIIPTPPPYFGDCGILRNWANEWLSGHPDYR